jgi:ATP diphosphatase
MAEEEGSFDFGGVVEAITEKLIRRHPHVFGDTRHLSPDQVKRLWAEIKATEKAERAARRELPPAPPGLLADIPGTFPPLLRALKLQSKASTVGFDWNDATAILAKIEEELAEVRIALAHGDAAAQRDEIGDLLFAVVNLARHVDVDPDMALRGTNAKFTRRFAAIEVALDKAGSSLAAATLDEMEALWQDAKDAERQPVAGKRLAETGDA